MHLGGDRGQGSGVQGLTSHCQPSVGRNDLCRSMPGQRAKPATWAPLLEDTLEHRPLPQDTEQVNSRRDPHTNAPACGRSTRPCPSHASHAGFLKTAKQQNRHAAATDGRAQAPRKEQGASGREAGSTATATLRGQGLSVRDGSTHACDDHAQHGSCWLGRTAQGTGHSRPGTRAGSVR